MNSGSVVVADRLSRHALRLVLLLSLLGTCIQAQNFKQQPGADCENSPCVTTFHNGTARGGVNGKETVLTPSVLTGGTFTLIANFDNLDGLVYAQPLYLSGVTMGTETHCPGQNKNVAIVATQNNSIYVYDVTSSSKIRLCYSKNTNAVGEYAIPYTDLLGSSPQCNNIVPQEGITGTPVIDTQVNPPAMFFVSAVRLPTIPTTWDYKLNVMSLNNGSAVQGSPYYLSKLIVAQAGGASFSALYQAQRTGVALFRPTGQNVANLYFGFGSHCDSTSYQGYVTGFQYAYGPPGALNNLGLFNTENAAGGSGAGIWMSGEAPPVDTNGNVYVATGNGPWVGKSSNPATPSQIGESVVQLVQSGSSLAAVDYYTPNSWSQLNVGSCPNGKPCENVCVVNNTTTSCPAGYEFSLNTNDWDLGSGGVTLIKPVGSVTSLCGSNGQLLAGGKEGIFYGVCYNSTSSSGGIMGGLDSCGYNFTSTCKSNLPAVALQSACTQSAAPAPGSIAQCFYGTPNLTQQNFGDATGNRGTPAFWGGSSSSPQNMLYVVGVSDVMRAYPYSSTLGTFSVANMATSTAPLAYNYPGATPAISWNSVATSNPNGTALVWAIENSGYGSLTKAASAATLFGYTAVPTSNANSAPTLSNDFRSDTLALPPGVNPGPGAVKFVVPTIAGGMVFVGGGAANPSYYFPGAGGSGTNCTPTYGGGSCLGGLYIYGTTVSK